MAWLIISRIYRTFGSDPNHLIPNVHMPDWEADLKSLKDINIEKSQMLSHLINRVYHIYVGYKYSNQSIDWTKNIEINEAADRLSACVHKFDKNQTISLIRNLSFYSIWNHKIWNELENHIMTNLNVEINGKDLVAIIDSIYRSYNHNDQFWEFLESHTIKVLSIETLTSGIYCSILLGFKEAGKGSPKLFEEIHKGLEKVIEDISVLNLFKIYQSYYRIVDINRNYLDSIFRKTIDLKSQLTNYNLQKAMIFLLKAKANDKYLDILEQEFFNKIQEFTLYNLANLTFGYYYESNNDKYLVPRVDRLLKFIEEYYSQNRDRILMETDSLDYYKQDLKIIWSLCRRLSFHNIEFWKNFAKELVANKDKYTNANHRQTKDLERVFSFKGFLNK